MSDDNIIPLAAGIFYVSNSTFFLFENTLNSFYEYYRSWQWWS